jgi:hypothetical protein
MNPYYRLSELKFTAPYFSAIDCILNGDNKCAIYCSTEVSSGSRLYEAMQKYEVTSTEELDKLDKNIYEHVKKTNKQEAKSFAASVRATQTDGTMVINPAPLLISHWDQPEYLAFWDELIRTRVKEVRFNKNWQFSNGCTYELAVALDECIATIDSDGNDLAADKAIADVEAAVRWLEDQGFSKAYKSLRKNLERLQPFGQPVVTRSSLKLPEKSRPKVGAKAALRTGKGEKK